MFPIRDDNRDSWGLCSDEKTAPVPSLCGETAVQHSKARSPQQDTLPSGSHTTAEFKFGFQAPRLPQSYSQWPHSPTYLPGNGFSVKPVYKYIQNIAGTVGSITDRCGVLSNITEEDHLVLGSLHAGYLDSHGYGSREVMQIVSAFDAPTIKEFISRTEGCGMSIVELEWFWCL